MYFFVTLCWRGRFLRLFKFCSISCTQGQVLAPVRALPGHAVTEFHAGTYQPQGFIIRDDSGFMAPTYPVGLPLHLVVVSWLAGSEATRSRLSTYSQCLPSARSCMRRAAT